jgi:hypothetical protein
VKINTPYKCLSSSPNSSLRNKISDSQGRGSSIGLKRSNYCQIMHTFVNNYRLILKVNYSNNQEMSPLILTVSAQVKLTSKDTLMKFLLAQSLPKKIDCIKKYLPLKVHSILAHQWAVFASHHHSPHRKNITFRFVTLRNS